VRHVVAVTGAVVSLALVVGGCGSSGTDAPAGARTVKVTLTDAGCKPAKLDLPAGPTTFEVTNDGAAGVSEFEILAGSRILGEVENVAPGLNKSFSLTLEAGAYVTYCPGGAGSERGALAVKGGPATTVDPAGETAVNTYRRYVERQTGRLVPRTEAFAAAVRAGDVAKAKRLYPAARVPYEAIEPVAESFGSLDPRIDARAGDVPRARWSGFHPIEQALWVKGTTKGQAANAAQLVADVKELRSKSATLKLEPAQIANGAVELLGEVSKSKITGEEERYSHLDLVDFEANVAGAKAAFDAVTPILGGKDKALVTGIEQRFTDVESALGRYRQGDGFVSYTKLTKADTRRLSQAVDALAEPLSQVAHVVVG
jgi:iron uptake system component EfeO